MSLGRKLSEIRARFDEVWGQLPADPEEMDPEDVRKLHDLVAANMKPLINAADRYDRTLNIFADQRWARAQMRETCDDFGVEPPPEIGKA